MGSRLQFPFWFRITVLFFLPSVAMADCTAPLDPGVRICSPSPNATVVFVAAIAFNSTPAFGAEIVKFTLYDNDHDEVDGFPGQTGETVIDAGIQNGRHKITINAWDTAGNLYQNSVSFTVVGNGFPTICHPPKTPGIDFCAPPADAVLGLDYPVSATAKGNSAIAALRLYVDGKSQVTQTQAMQQDPSQLSTLALVSSQGDHQIAFVAWDTSGHVFNATRKIHSTYTYSAVDCPPKGDSPCSPGFDTVLTPEPDSYVGNSFTLQNQILNNSNPITTIKAYIDNTLVATSHGPTMMAPVDNAPTGTHIITLQAWDNAGTLYRMQYNVNINMQH